MRKERVGCLLICEGERMVGIFTERDLLRRVLAAGKPLTLTVAECMTPNPVAVHCTEPVGAALRRMEEGGYRHLPVVDETGRVVGLRGRRGHGPLEMFHGLDSPVQHHGARASRLGFHRR